MKLPREIGPIHFVGIGGIGMSGIAEVLMNLGYTVQGSDASDNANVKRLRDLGAKVAIGHKAENLDGAEVLVVSSAIKRDNPELVAAREKRLPVVRRAEMLAELMRLKSCVAIAGTHGKTTTTSLVAALLDAANFDPTVINGGIINAYGTNARLGAGDWMVVEADESDGTFLKLPADIAIVTNIDAEHLDHFKTFVAVQDAFRAFIENVPFYGFAVMCTDHPIVQRLVGRIEDRRIITYGENPQADVRLTDLRNDGGRQTFTVLFRDRDGQTIHTIKDLTLPMPGRHNALNATSAVAVARELKDSGRGNPQGAGFVRRRQAALHPRRRMEWRDHHRRLRPPSGRDRGGAQGRARIHQGPGHRGGAAAPLHAPAVVVRAVLDLLQRRRRGDRRRGLSGRRGADPGHRPRSSRHRRSRARPSPGRSAAGPAGARRHRQGPRQARRLRGLPRRGQHHAVGLFAGRRVEGAGLMSFPDIVSELKVAAPQLRGRLLPNQSLAELTWFRVGGPAQVLFMPEDEADLAYFLGALSADIPVTVVGLGSNLIVRDGGVPGVVVRLGRGFNEVAVDGTRVKSGTAVPDVKVARAAQEAGLAGLAFLRGIPGAIGGALRMNGGAYKGETKDVLVEARAVDRQGRIHTLNNADMHYSYRHCGAPEDFIFTEATFEGTPGDRAAIAAEMDKITESREATQPIKSRTGGSTFKNPPGQKAWQLIDAAGCRGLIIGGAQVSELHCNFLINLGTATAADIETLGETVRRRVKDNSGVELEWEIKRIGIPA